MSDSTWQDNRPLEDWEYPDPDPDDDDGDDDEVNTPTRPCQACGADIYDDAFRCPACGEELPEGVYGLPRWWMLLGRLGIAAIIAMLILPLLQLLFG